MEIENYSYLDEAKIVDSNGSKYAVGEDSSGYLTILNGELYVDEETGEEKFWAYEKEQQGFVQIPKEDLRSVL
jgi:hypothetical protein